MTVMTISRVERLSNTQDGNPRFRVVFTDGRAVNTKPDAAVAYKIENSEFLNVPVEVTFTDYGTRYVVNVETMER